MPKFNFNRKIIIILLLVVAVLAVGYWLAVKNNQKSATVSSNEQNSSPAEDPVTPKFEYAPADKAPTGFPDSVPIEKDAKITENNFSLLTEENKTVAVREFVSKYSLSENYELYKKYLTDNGYVLEDDISQAEQKIVSGIKDRYRLRVRIYKTEKETLVAVNYVQM